MGRRNTSLLIILLVIFSMISENVFAQSTQYKRKKAKKDTPAADANAVAPAPSGNKDEKLDVKGLEEKYWTSQDTDFTVVQNRTYTKAGRYSASLSLGMPTNDSYNAGTLYSLSINYYFTERHGMEFNYTSYGFHNSAVVDGFNSSNGVLPDRDRDLSYYGFSYNWVPVYAKASLLGSKIMYFDFSISPGIGMVKYQEFVSTGDQFDNALAFSLDFTQQFFLSKEFALRIDFKNRWQAEKVLKYQQGTGGAPTGSQMRNDMFNSNFLVFGLTYFF